MPHNKEASNSDDPKSTLTRDDDRDKLGAIVTVHGVLAGVRMAVLVVRCRDALFS